MLPYSIDPHTFNFNGKFKDLKLKKDNKKEGKTDERKIGTD